MKNSIVGIILAALMLAGCAHKSGRKTRISQNAVPSVASSGDLRVDIRSGGSRMDGTEIFRRYSPAVFMVYTTDGMNTYQGSGFFINESGLALSNYHVFKGTGIGDEQIKLNGSNEMYKVAEIIHRDEDNDFILFRVDIDKTPCIPIAAQKPQVGEKVYAIGSPHGLENTFSSGEVSQWRDTYLMQISALIDHGSSGGALINEQGQVVGITSGSFADGSQANLNYAWSIEAVKPYIKKK